MKKILIIFLVICSIISLSTCYATYSDIEGNKYKESIEYLSGMEIISGYEDGAFKPDKSITRSEMAKLLVETSGVDIESVNETKSIFYDVPMSHWAIKYINIAQSQGLIKGDGNGSFRPNDTINYGETVTMVVRMLGYDVNVEGVGNWPDNYLKKADELKLFNNIETVNKDISANRGTVAQILYNSVKSINTNAEYPIVKACKQFQSLRNKTIEGNLGKYSEDISMKTIIDANFEIEGEGINDDAELQLLKTIINDSKFEVITNSSINNKFVQFIGKWIVNNEEMLQGELNLTDDKIYVKIKDIFDKYLVEESDTSIFDKRTNNISNDDDVLLSQRLISIFNVLMQKNVKTSNTEINISDEKQNVTKTVLVIDKNDLNKIELDYYKSILNNERLFDAYTKDNYYINNPKEGIESQISYLEKAIENPSTASIYGYKDEYTITIYSKGELCEIVGVDIEYKETDIDENVVDNLVNITGRIAQDRLTISYNKEDNYGDKVSMKFDFKDNYKASNMKFECAYVDEVNENEFEITLNLDTEILDTKVIIPTFNSTMTELDEETQKKLENKIMEIVQKMGLKDKYDEYIKKQEGTLNNAKKAVFFNDIANINDGVILKRLENMAYQISEWDGIISDDTVVVNGITCNKFVSNANEEMALVLSNLHDFAVDKETGKVYYIKGIVITQDGIPYTYYNSTTYVEGAKSGAIKIQDYNK